jgi:hypothetical protein
VDRFLARHAQHLLGTLAGFDRVVFRGSLPSICNLRSLLVFLSYRKILWKNFGAFARQQSDILIDHAKQLAQQQGRPYLYFQRQIKGKDEVARRIQQRDGVTSGLIAIFACVERCNSFSVRGDRQTRHIHLIAAQRKCLHLYFYFQHPEFGLLHVRLQTWLPFSVTVCLNGRSYLAQQLDQAGIAYTKKTNGFTSIADLPRAQALLDQLTTFRWGPFLTELLRPLHPLLDDRFGFDQHGYYWTMDQSEYATDLLFRDAASLQAFYPRLVAYALERLRAPDILRFLGRTNVFTGEVAMDVRKRVEGVCVKHRVGRNSVKMYDKHGSILRIEVTINDPRQFLVRRWVRRRQQHLWRNVPMCKGVKDVPDRVAHSQRVNARYLEFLAEVEQPQPVAATLDPVSRPVQKDGRRYRALRPLTPEESAAFAVLLEGRFALRGFRNRDLAAALGPTPRNLVERLRRSARTSRYLKLLRVHGLIRKIPHTHCYCLTPKGLRVLPLALRLRELDLPAIAA